MGASHVSVQLASTSHCCLKAVLWKMAPAAGTVSRTDISNAGEGARGRGASHGPGPVPSPVLGSATALSSP